MTGLRIKTRRTNTGWALLGIAVAMSIVTAAGIFHVWNAQQNLALRRAIWKELGNSRVLESERTLLRQEQARIMAVPRATVKAQVMGLRPPRADQVIQADEIEEAPP